jgi:pyrroline-5-carboxylate reductase
MASALIGGLRRRGVAASAIEVVEPHAPTRERLRTEFGVQALPEAARALGRADVVVWAVKPQAFSEAAGQVRPHLGRQSLHLSVAAGIRTESMQEWLGTGRIVRAMPNTPALVGQGMTALFATQAVTAQDRAAVEQVIAPTGELLWMDSEPQLDAVTALSGSGPAYVFLFLEAMVQAGSEMGLTPDQARSLAIGTFAGASRLARDSQESLQVLRERVTSKGGTTHAAISSMQEDGVSQSFIKAMHAACRRAAELGDEFGR